MDIHRITAMTINQNINTMAVLRLMHLVSPSLPTGGFAYSQGLEWAIECGWVTDEKSLLHWLENILESSMASVDIPLLRRLYAAAIQKDSEAFSTWAQWVLACRETSELQMEEKNRGRAMAALLKELDIPLMTVPHENIWHQVVSSCQLAGFALAAAHWEIPVKQTGNGYVWAWLENQVLSGVKIIPLGQTAGQKILKQLIPHIEHVVQKGMETDQEDIGASLPALAIASSCHETQYTRLFRS